METEIPEAPPEARTRNGFRVRATQLGYYGDKRRRVGDVFTISSEAVFSAKWMEWVDRRTPGRVTSSPEALKAHHDEIQAARYAPAGSMHAGDDDDNPIGG